MPHGKLSVIVESATNIQDPGIRGNGGSYCILTCGSQARRSRVVEGGGRNPLFSTPFEFEIDGTTNGLKVCIYRARGSPRQDELLGYSILIFKQVFYHGHTLPLTSYPLQLPSGNPAGQIRMALKFKMRPPPNAQGKAVSSLPGGTPKLVVQQVLSLDWGYDCRDEADDSRARAETLQPENGTHNAIYRNLPGSASGVYKDSSRGFLRYGNPGNFRTPSHTQPNSAAPERRSSEDIDENLPQFGKPENQVVRRPQLVQVEAGPGDVASACAAGEVYGPGSAFGDDLVNNGVGSARLQGRPFDP